MYINDDLDLINSSVITDETIVYSFERECDGFVNDDVLQTTTTHLTCKEQLVMASNTTILFEYTEENSVIPKYVVLICTETFSQVITGKKYEICYLDQM